MRADLSCCAFLFVWIFSLGLAPHASGSLCHADLHMTRWRRRLLGLGRKSPTFRGVVATFASFFPVFAAFACYFFLD
uniref:Secreted peptide n=1 Tax=Arundo donax TaxID=35708 RepID=A0A0A8Y420_ARUDO